MPSGEEALDGMIARLRGLRDFATRAAAAAAPLVEAVQKRTAAAGTTVNGERWEPLKYSGGRALAKAADNVSARAVGTIVQIVLRGPYVLHHFGDGHAPRRPIIPEAGDPLPASFRNALVEGARRAFRSSMGGGK
jgi:hypothetical protein